LSAVIQAPLKDLHLDWPGKPPFEQMVYRLVKSDPEDEFEFEVIDKPTSTTFFDKEADDTNALKVGPPPEPPKSTLTAPAIQQFPETIPPLYNVSRQVIFLLFPWSQPTPQDVTLKGTLTDGTVMSLNVPVTEVATEDDAKPIIHTLAARTLLSELQEHRLIVQLQNTDGRLDDAVKREGIRVGVNYGLTSKWTVFVAVDEKNPDEIVCRNTFKNVDEQSPRYKSRYRFHSPKIPLVSTRPCCTRGVSGNDTDSEESSDDDEQKLQDIIRHQLCSGMFEWSDTLRCRLGFDSIGAVKDKLPPALENVSIDVWITILVCVFLEKKLTGEEKTWELVVEKAWAYVDSNVDAGKVAKLKEAAERQW
jgi:hypothetical protein